MKFVDIKVLIIKRDNPLEEPQITDRGLTVVRICLDWLI